MISHSRGRDQAKPMRTQPKTELTPNARATYQVPPSPAKRLECVRLAGAFPSPGTTAIRDYCFSSKRRRSALSKDGRTTRSVWSASGLPALFHRARPGPRLLPPAKAGASSTHSKRWRAVPESSPKQFSPSPRSRWWCSASHFKNTFIPLFPFHPKSRCMRASP